MENRIKFNVDNVIHNSRVHAAGDVVEVDDEQFARFVKREKVAVETDEEPTVFPSAVETATDEPTDPPDGGQVNAQKAVKSASSRR